MPQTYPAERLRAWFAQQGFSPFDFQRQCWAALAQGRSGLLHANTGSGKTLAVWGGALQVACPEARGLQWLWLTPMRALAADTCQALQAPLAAVLPGWKLGLRTGDTPSAERARQDRAWPQVLVTTPESLSLMLSRPDAAQRFAGLQGVVVDEWHELLGNKRGVQVQLALARLQGWCPSLRIWGISATLGDLNEALRALLPGSPGDATPPPVMVQGRVDKSLQIDTLLPSSPSALSWAGHMGSPMVAPLVDELASAGTTLVFTNTRSQAELWYQALLDARPDWAGLVALHHGSLDADVRAWVEQGLKDGRLKAVVATSSLDLGVDFLAG